MLGTILFIAASLALAWVFYMDVKTTNEVLAQPGGYEKNPVMAFAQRTLGKLWWTVEAVAWAVIVTATLLLLGSTLLGAIVLAALAMVRWVLSVQNNLTVLSDMKGPQ
ncbi:MAG: hypothetical protein ACP5QR_04940 [Rhizomicrobium sp.]